MFIVLTVLALVGVTTMDALAKARRVSWHKVEVPGEPDSKQVSRQFKRLLKQKSRRVKWGKGDQLKLHARVTKMQWRESKDVLRLTLTVVGRIEGGKGARSHIRVGGRPNQRKKLRTQALSIVAEGLVTRLSTLSR